MNKLCKKKFETEERIKNDIVPDYTVPEKIKWAARLLYIALCIQFVYMAILQEAFHTNVFRGKMLISLIVGGAVLVIFAQLINQGKKWPRIVLLIFSILGLYFYYLAFSVGINFMNTYSNLAYFTLTYTSLQLALRIVTLILLFHPDSNHWYKTGELERKPEAFDQI